MAIAKKISVIEEEIDINYQLIACELDTSVKNMKYISKDILQDAITLESFEKLVKNIEIEDGTEITSFDDNTVLYEYENEAIILHTTLGNKYIIFDEDVRKKIENKLNYFR